MKHITTIIKRIHFRLSGEGLLIVVSRHLSLCQACFSHDKHWIMKKDFCYGKLNCQKMHLAFFQTGGNLMQQYDAIL